LKQWEIDLTTKHNRELYSDSINHNKQQEVEKRVTKYIQENISFVVLRLDDADKRKYFEQRIIGTVSKCGECAFSENSLGNLSPKEKIRRSGLWLIQHLWSDPLNESDMRELKKLL
jgi:hypothetical protein